MSEKEALLNFIGSVYGHMKEIDNNIAAAGSNAKFGGRSADLKNVFEQVAAASVVQQPALNFTQPAPGMEVITTPQQLGEVKYITPPQPVQQQPINQQLPVDQLEFVFKEDANSVLKDIYNILFDIKKILISYQNNQNEKPVKKNKKYADCCLCGSKPAYNKDRETHTMQCTGCGSKEVATTEQSVKTSWNNNNKRL